MRGVSVLSEHHDIHRIGVIRDLSELSCVFRNDAAIRSLKMPLDYLPLNTGSLFSTKALKASRESSLAPVRLWRSVSSSM